MNEIWFQRGTHPPHSVTLPFFVEVQMKNNMKGLLFYLEEMLNQYKHYEIQVFSENQNLIKHLIQTYPLAQKEQNIISITK